MAAAPSAVLHAASASGATPSAARTLAVDSGGDVRVTDAAPGGTAPSRSAPEPPAAGT